MSTNMLTYTLLTIFVVLLSGCGINFEEWEFEDKLPGGIKIKFTLLNGEKKESIEKTIFIIAGELGEEA